jgi:hypothetical protein
MPPPPPPTPPTSPSPILPIARCRIRERLSGLIDADISAVLRYHRQRGLLRRRNGKRGAEMIPKRKRRKTFMFRALAPALC